MRRFLLVFWTNLKINLRTLYLKLFDFSLLFTSGLYTYWVYRVYVVHFCYHGSWHRVDAQQMLIYYHILSILRCTYFSHFNFSEVGMYLAINNGLHYCLPFLKSSIPPGKMKKASTSQHIRFDQIWVINKLFKCYFSRVIIILIQTYFIRWCPGDDIKYSFTVL